MVSKPMSHYTGSPRMNDSSRNSGLSDLIPTSTVNNNKNKRFYNHMSQLQQTGLKLAQNK